MGKFDTSYFVKNVSKIKQCNFSEMLSANCELESLFIDKKNSTDFFSVPQFGATGILGEPKIEFLCEIYFVSTQFWMLYQI